MQAVFYSIEEMEIIKQDILFLAIIQESDDENGYDIVRPFVGERDGGMVDPSWLDGFLGVEYDGVSNCWDTEIREYEKEIEDKKGGNGKPRVVN
jgi:hypothetical protein